MASPRTSNGIKCEEFTETHIAHTCPLAGRLTQSIAKATACGTVNNGVRGFHEFIARLG